MSHQEFDAGRELASIERALEAIAERHVRLRRAQAELKKRIFEVYGPTRLREVGIILSNHGSSLNRHIFFLF